MQLHGSLVLVALALAGCATSSPAEQVPTSGWLADYTRLADDRPGVLYRSEPGTSLTGYRALLLEPVEVWPEGADAPRRSFAQRLEQVLHQRLGERFDLAEAAGPGVLVARFAVTEADAGAVAKPGGFYRGQASVEGQLLDGESRRERVALVARRLGGKSVWVEGAAPEDAQAIAEHWSKGLIDALIERGMHARPAPSDPGGD